MDDEIYNESNRIRRRIRETFESRPSNQWGFNYLGHLIPTKPDRDMVGRIEIRNRYRGVWLYAGEISFWSSQGGGLKSFSDAVWLGQYFFNSFTIITYDENDEIIDIDEF